MAELGTTIAGLDQNASVNNSFRTNDTYWDADRKAIFGKASDEVDQAFAEFFFDSAAGVFRIDSTKDGAGVASDIVVRTGDPLADAVRIDTSQRVGVHGDWGSGGLGPMVFAFNVLDTGPGGVLQRNDVAGRDPSLYRFFRTRAGGPVLAADGVFAIQASFLNSLSVTVTNAALTYTVVVPTSGAEETSLSFQTLIAGATRVHLTFAATGINVGSDIVTGIGNTFRMFWTDGTAALPSITFAADTNTGFFRPAVGDSIGFTVGGSSVELRKDPVFDPQLLMRGGAETAPAYSFISDTDTGIFQAGLNSISFVTGGLTVCALTSTRQLFGDWTLAAGTPGVPFYTFNADDDTGMYRIAANTLGFSAGGTERFRVTTTGATVTGKLTVTGSIDPTDITLSGGGTAHWQEWGAGSTAGVSAASTGRIRYNEVANEFQMSLNGAAYVAMGASFPLLAPNGTAGAPSYSFSGDTNTGIFQAAASLDTLSITAGGGEVCRFVSVGGIKRILMDTFTDPGGFQPMFLQKNVAGSYVIEIRNSGSGTTAEGGFIARNNSASAFFTVTSTGWATANARKASWLNVLTAPSLHGTQFISQGIGAGDGFEWVMNVTLRAALVFDTSNTNPQFRGSDGNASRPFWTFLSDTDTGMFRAGVDTIGLSTGGTQRLSISTTAITATLDATWTATNFTVNGANPQITASTSVATERGRVSALSNSGSMIIEAFGSTFAGAGVENAGNGVVMASGIPLYIGSDSTGILSHLFSNGSDTDIAFSWRHLSGVMQLSFYGVTTVNRASATDDIKDALTAYGLLQGTSATPLDLDGGLLSAGRAVLNQSAAAGAVPVLQLTQADVSEEFIRFIGTAAAGVLTQSIVDAGDVLIATTQGYLKVFVQDDGDQIADSSYYVPIVTLT